MAMRPSAAVQAFFDAECGFCARSARWVRRLDRARRIQLTPLGDATGMAGSPSPASLASSLHARDRSGRWFSGGDAWLRLAAEVPGLRPVGRLRRFSVARRAFDLAYRLIAANRHRLSRLMGDQACATGARRTD